MVVRAAVGGVLALVAAEIYVRPVYSLRLVYEPGLGYVNAPGRTRFGLEGGADSTWLPHGERLTTGAPSDGSIALVLGDSFTEAMMIPDDKTFVSVAQTTLSARGAALRLRNAGRSTLSVADYVGLAPRYRELFPSSWTVVQLRGNDLADDAWAPGRTRFVRGASGDLGVAIHIEAERTGARALWFDVRQRSMAIGYAAVRLGKFASIPEPPLFRAGYARAPSPEPPPPPVEEELDLLFGAWDRRVTLLYLSSYDAPDPVEERVRAYCAARDASCVFTVGAYAALRSEGKAPTGFSNTAFGVGHLNVDGHALAGRLLAAELERLQPTIAGASQ